MRNRFFTILMLSAFGTLWFDDSRPACAQFISPSVGTHFELAESIELDRADGAALAQLERVKAFLADKKWDEAMDTLLKLTENSEGKLIAVAENRFVGLGDYCQMRLASLPPDALKLYRGRADPAAREWYEAGMADRDPRPLQKIVDQAFASGWGDDALLALGDMALEAADFAAARWYWERIIPHAAADGQSAAWPGYPDTDLDIATVRARLVLASILEGSSDRAREELDEFTRLHGDSRGRLGGREVIYAQALNELLSESTARPAPQKPDWPTFAGSPGRNTISPQKFDAGPVAWRVPLPRVAAASSERKVSSADYSQLLSYHPAIVGDLVLINTSREVLALRLSTGQPAWGLITPAIYSQPPDQSGADLVPSPNSFGAPRFTLTVFGDKLYAHMGPSFTAVPQGQPGQFKPGCLIALDLAAQGRLLWKIVPEEGWTFDGSPIADGASVYVAMRRIDIRPRAYVACFDARSGRQRWRQFVVSAETPARGQMFQVTHNLLTLAANTIYFNTNLGAVAALNANDGRVRWISLYPRQRQGDLGKLDPHWLRDLNPCVYHRGAIYAAPADSPRIFALDAFTGQIIWQTGTQTEYALDLLGATDDYLIAGGKKLYWIGLKDEDRGRIKHIWPDGNEKLGFGRGILADGCALWPTKERILVFDLKTGQARKSIELAPINAQGGNLLVTDHGLLIAAANELIALRKTNNPPQEKQREIASVK